MVITNDGATILNKMVVTQPAAKMLVELSKSQACPFALPPHDICTLALTSVELRRVNVQKVYVQHQRGFTSL